MLGRGRLAVLGMLVAGWGCGSGENQGQVTHVKHDAAIGTGGGASGGTPVPSGGAGGGVPDSAVDCNAVSSNGGSGGSSPDVGAGNDWLAVPAVAPSLTVPARATIKLHGHGSGIQIYTCAASAPTADAGAGAPTYAWVLKAPNASLADEHGELFATHGGGPSWTSTADGSAITGAKVMQVDSPLQDAIPWLLLRVSASTGTGIFSDISYVQRLTTQGGKAPSTGCDASVVGSESRIDYSAEYYFYSSGSGTDWLTLPAEIPAALSPPVDAVLKLHDRGIGAQVYVCTASGADAGEAPQYGWALKAPDAILYDEYYGQAGTHGAGPHWTALDGSTVSASKLAQANAPATGAIPWLLLGATNTSGNGLFSDVAYVQRLNTAGGIAPTTGCDGTTLNAEKRADYAADYYFFTRPPVDGGAGI